MEVMPEDTSPGCCEKDSSSYAGCCEADSFSDGYRARNLWIDVLTESIRAGQHHNLAMEVADTVVDRYKAKFDVK